MNYEAIYGLLARYSPQTLPYFADAWGRMPQGGHARLVVEDLSRQRAFWAPRDSDLGAKFTAAIEAIEVQNI